MISFQLLREEGILLVSPEGRLGSKDFERLAQEIDPYLKQKGHLAGLMIRAKSFPGWKDFSALIGHFKFVKNHHKKIQRVAAVTDSGFLSIMPHVMNHIVQAEVKHFDSHDQEAALKWLKTGSIEGTKDKKAGGIR